MMCEGGCPQGSVREVLRPYANPSGSEEVVGDTRVGDVPSCSSQSAHCPDPCPGACTELRFDSAID